MQPALPRLKTALCRTADSLVCPKNPQTNRNTGLIRLIAFAAMAVDHAGKMLFPQYPALRLIGRLAFPLFAYLIAVGAVYTRDPLRYLSRVVALALISQPLYALALDHETAAMYAVPFLSHPLQAMCSFYMGSWQKPSILLSLSLGLALLLCLRSRRFALALGLYVLCERFAGSLDYGIHGIRLMLLFYALCEHPLCSLAATLSYLLLVWAKGFGYSFFGFTFGMQVYALPALLFVHLPLRSRLKLPRVVAYGFYPAHLLVLALIVKLA
ncbi:MAG: TraX family protein [Clostridia bacterium]|nr:TraX family protein [Clostridia bacterium]